VVRASIAGRILRLVASPGARVMGLDANAGHSSSTVVEMYDPAKLQVRADVRLEHVPKVLPSAPVEIETASSGRVIRGRVLQSTSSANIQKNTLEVKVELIEPPPNVSPEMLVTATFLAPKLASASDGPSKMVRIYVPDQLVQSGDNGPYVWIIDANNQAVQRMLAVGGATSGGLVEITAGLNVTDKLISSGLENLKPGDAVVVSGEDQTIGVGRQ
jgi:HlyD family secretion protein